jgi:hypothetical protein
VWFKAVGEQNKREFAITLHLTQFFPEYAPAVLASRADWSAWLSREIEGSSLAEALDLSQWKHAAESLAKLQIQSIETCDRLLHAGAHDLRLETLLSDVAPFMDLATTLMEEQSKTPPPILSSADLKVVEWRICDALSRLSQLDIPDTLGNVDLNPGTYSARQMGAHSSIGQKPLLDTRSLVSSIYSNTSATPGSRTHNRKQISHLPTSLPGGGLHRARPFPRRWHSFHS